MFSFPGSCLGAQCVRGSASVEVAGIAILHAGDLFERRSLQRSAPPDGSPGTRCFPGGSPGTRCSHSFRARTALVLLHPCIVIGVHDEYPMMRVVRHRRAH